MSALVAPRMNVVENLKIPAEGLSKSRRERLVRRQRIEKAVALRRTYCADEFNAEYLQALSRLVGVFSCEVDSIVLRMLDRCRQGFDEQWRVDFQTLRELMDAQLNRRWWKFW